MTILLSEIYDVTLKRGIRGKASEGFVRPTIGESFMTDQDYTTVSSELSVGDLVDGGYYFGDILIESIAYRLFCAPKSSGESYLQWKTTLTNTLGTNDIDGKSNTAAMITAGASDHPAANFCNNLTIGGHTDWYFPSKDELNLLYNNRIVLENAGAGNWQQDDYYWSSTEYSAPDAWLQAFWGYDEQDFYGKYFNGYIRAIRRVQIT